MTTMAEGSTLNFSEELKKLPGNVCADCGKSNPLWMSCSYNVLLCETCANIHEKLLQPGKNQIKNIKDTKWTTDEIQKLMSSSVTNKQFYERHVPPCYRRPKPNDHEVLLEQWIKAKYERKEFTQPNAKLSYLKDHKEGYLWKQGKGSRQFNRRRFILDIRSNTLRYYNKEGAKDPKAVMVVDRLNVLIVPEKVGNPNGMQIIFEQDGFSRSLFVYAETGEDLIDWYTALRSAKLNRLAIAYPASEIDELASMLSTDFVKEGWLNKSGPRATDAYRKRWVTLDTRNFMYYDDPLNPFPKGEVFVGSNEKSFYVSDSHENQPLHSFAVHTPHRVFHFSAESEELKCEWITAFRSVISTPVTPKEQSSASTKKRNSIRESMLTLLKR